MGRGESRRPGERFPSRRVMVLVTAIALVAISACATDEPVAKTPQECLNIFFEDVPDERITRVEHGTREVDLLDGGQSKAEPFGLTITDRGEPVLHLRIDYFDSGEIFRIDSAGGPLCRPAEDIRNADRPGEGDTLQNWDTAEIDVADSTYEVRLGADEGIVSLNHVTRQ